MRPLSVTLKGFGSHVDTDWQLNGGRLVMLIGDMGAGKSSLASKSLRYALFDEPRRRASELLRTGSSDMSVTVEFEHGGERYRIARGYSSKAGGKSFAEFGVFDRDNESWVPLTGDTIDETNARIERKLGMDAATFRAASHLVQGDIHAFADAGPGARKQVLARALNIDHPWSAAAAIAATRLDEVGREIRSNGERRATINEQRAAVGEVIATRDAARHRLEAIEIEAGLVEIELADHRAALVDLAGSIAEATAAEREVTRLTAQREEQRLRWKDAHARELAAGAQLARALATIAQAPAIEGAAKEVRRLERALAKARAAADEYRAGEQAHERAKSERGMAQHDIKAAEERVAGLVAQRDDTTVCPECGATIPAGGRALEERIAAAQAAVATARDALAALPPIPALPPLPTADAWALQEELNAAQALVAARPALAEARQIEAEANATIEAAGRDKEAALARGRDAHAAVAAAQAAAARLAPLRDAVGQHNEAVEQLSTQARVLAAETRSREAERARAEAQLEQLEAAAAERDRLLERHGQLASLLARLSRLVTAFGPKGIPARIIDSAVPELTAHANELLAQLVPGMSLDIRTQRAKKAGDGLIEALDVLVRDEGGERPLGTFSGGEQTSISVALAVGISRLVARRSGAAVRSMVIDEPDGLDPDGRRAFGQALKVLAHSGELERIVVITHSPDLADLGDEVWHVTKDDDRVSHLELVA